MGGLIRLLTSALTASLYRRIAHVLKPPDVLIKGVTSFLKPGAQDAHEKPVLTLKEQKELEKLRAQDQREIKALKKELQRKEKA